MREERTALDDPFTTRDTADLDAPQDVAQEVDHGVTPGTTVGRYIVLHAIGQGGAGVVYAAYDPRLDRKVALKLLRSKARDHNRLLREAQALAQLSHPNVVAVHDVGSFEDRVFVAMELVQGVTLRAWLKAAPRGVKDVLGVFLAAAQGLTAAHARGLIHLDFKPDNVLVGEDGSVRVVDFGLAVRADTRESERTTPSDDEEVRQIGGQHGTPGYMAPEQYLSESTDTRTDQFAFCAALFEGLYGALPFAGSSYFDLAEATCAGTVREVSATSRVATHVRRAILRGLSVEPQDRWPSLAALGAELRRDPHAPFRRGAFALVLIGAAMSLLSLTVGPDARNRESCVGADALVAQTWNARTEASIGRAFAATGLSYAAQAQHALVRAMADFARRWAVARREACLATRVRGEQSEEVLSRRLTCLDGKLEEFRALARVMGEGGRDVVQRAVEASSGLPSLHECSDVAALTSDVNVPSQPAVRAAVEQHRLALAAPRALVSAGRYDEAVRRLRQLVSEADAIDFVPLRAETRLELGTAQVGAGDYDGAEQVLSLTEELAEECHHDLVRGRALVTRLEVTGRWLGHYDRAATDARRARSLALRLREPELQWAALDANARIHGYTGQLALSLDEARQSVALAQKLFGTSDLRLARAHGALSIALGELSRVEEAEQEDRLALAITERALGASHPALVRLLNNAALSAVWAGKPGAAIPLAQRAATLAVAELGADHPQHGLAQNGLGYAQLALGQYTDSIASNQESLRVCSLRGDDQSECVYPHLGLGEALLELDRAREALPHLERATRMAEAHDLDAETMGDCHFHLGRALGAVQGDWKRAEELVRRAVEEYARIPRLSRRRERAEHWLHDRAHPRAAVAASDVAKLRQGTAPGATAPRGP